ncbi:MAG: bifunctional UDP-N-acetylglucosamine diphosphorylase/glucosamine-1-phosphate N-acetyltransferase GlmU [Ruminobacter sp.]|nr:bifunctional UDP-N-acetylglucosamine diphosphorylase/glucosamine-1-phosphate N-acetyltransferase GlmU [Ruminobacter sp.]
MSLEIIILAAGKGSRMHSHLPKVLHKVAGKEIISHVIDHVKPLQPDNIHIVYGFGGDLVKNTLGEGYDFVYQKELLGTAHAVQQALPNCKKNSKILVLVSDIPLISTETLKKLLDNLKDSSVAVLTSIVERPFGLGRIIRDSNGFIKAIVEQKDCNEEQALINEINTGVIASDTETLEKLIAKVENNNAQKEYYLTDICKLANEAGLKVSGVASDCPQECEGINDKVQLARAERFYQENKAISYMKEGLIIIDPQRVDFRGDLKFGENTTLDVNVTIEGNVTLGSNVVIGQGCVLKDCTIGDNSVISPYTIIESGIIGKNATLGPFARFRPGCELDDNVHVGNFVEVKKSKLGKGTKAGHLSYLGDSEIGSDVNIGAGTITCNYDGANKFKTVIGDDVFVGSDTQLVAPVNVGKGATIGAGTTVTKDVKENALVITRVPMRQIDNWQRPTKKNK